MNDIDKLRTRMEMVVFELEALFKLFEKEASDPQAAVSLQQVKEIESSIDRLKKQGFPVPAELKQLKLKLFSAYERHKEFLLLQNNFLNSIQSLISSFAPPRISHRRSLTTHKPIQTSFRKPPDYERPLGSKGNSNLEDYLIPVIKLMWSGHDHKEAFRIIKEKLNVRYNTVSSQCTRALGLTTEDFIKRVESKTIVDLIEYKFPDRYQKIKSELKK
jgi:hypothetical protein